MWHKDANGGDVAARSAGFTLIEMMVVMGIMVMMITMSIPALDAYLKHEGPKSGARIVQGTLFAAKMTAIRDRRITSFDVRPFGSLCGFKVVRSKDKGGLKIITADSSEVRWIDDFFKEAKDSNKKKIPGTERFLRLRHPGNRKVASEKIFGNTADTITCKRIDLPKAGEMVDIMVSPEVERFCVTPDRASEIWEMLPRWVEVTAFPGTKETLNALPISFKPDGSLHFDKAHYPRVTVKIKDTRAHLDTDDDRNAFLIVVRRNTGSIRLEKIAGE